MSFGLTIHVDNVNDALRIGTMHLLDKGKPVESRGMLTLEYPGPVSTVYANPLQRVLFDPVRDANPFFHLMESLWILSGSDNVALPKHFLSSIDRFSDDGRTFHGAYGHRLRKAFHVDQLLGAVELLQATPDSRQVVLSIWHPELDLGAETKDMPCNDMVMLKVRDGKLNMTVCNRSNDMVWGAYGANAVQFSMLQEWLAAAIGVEVGYYVQQSDSYHVYVDNPFWAQVCEKNYRPAYHSAYDHTELEVEPYPLVEGFGVNDRRWEATKVLADCEALDKAAQAGMGLGVPAYQSQYFKNVVCPVMYAYSAYKDKGYTRAVEALQHCMATDWRMAMQQWVQRRQANATKKEQA